MPTETEELVLKALQGLLDRTIADSQTHRALEDLKREEAIYIRRTIELFQAEVKAREEILREMEKKREACPPNPSYPIIKGSPPPKRKPRPRPITDVPSPINIHLSG